MEMFDRYALLYKMCGNNLVRNPICLFGIDYTVFSLKFIILIFCRRNFSFYSCSNAAELPAILISSI